VTLGDDSDWSSFGFRIMIGVEPEINRFFLVLKAIDTENSIEVRQISHRPLAYFAFGGAVGLRVVVWFRTLARSRVGKVFITSYRRTLTLPVIKC